MKNCKKFKTIDLTTNQRKEFSHYRYITQIMIDHAIQCKERWCVCRASSFNDALADFRHDAPANLKREIDEVLNRDVY